MQYNHPQYVVVAAAIIIMLSSITTQPNGRELRPSDHGLSYEEDSLPPAQNGAAQELSSFFGPTTTPSLPMPEAQSIGGTWWNVERSRDTRMDHVRVGLMVASGVCGLTGVVLLVVSGIVFLFRLQKRISIKEGGNSATSAPACVVPHAVSDDKK